MKERAAEGSRAQSQLQRRIPEYLRLRATYLSSVSSLACPTSTCPTSTNTKPTIDAQSHSLQAPLSRTLVLEAFFLLLLLLPTMSIQPALASLLTFQGQKPPASPLATPSSVSRGSIMRFARHHVPSPADRTRRQTGSSYSSAADGAPHGASDLVAYMLTLKLPNSAFGSNGAKTKRTEEIRQIKKRMELGRLY